MLCFSLSSDFKVSQKTLTISIVKCIKNVTGEKKIVIQCCNSDESNTLSSFQISMYLSTTIIHLPDRNCASGSHTVFAKLKKKKKKIPSEMESQFCAMLFHVLDLLSLAPKGRGSLALSCHWLLLRPASGSQNTQLRFCLLVWFRVSRVHSIMYINTLMCHSVEVAHERVTSDAKYLS